MLGTMSLPPVRHADLVPIEPNELTDAMGLIRLEAGRNGISGPTLRENLLEIRSQIPRRAAI